jgi:hypothetical protein
MQTRTTPNRLVATALAGACLLAAPPATAASGEPPAKTWYGVISVNEFAEASYTANFGRPDSERNALRVFDTYDRALKLDVVELVVQRAVSKPGEFGFRFDATAGQTVPKAEAAYGLFRDTSTGEAHDYDLQQGFVSFIAPLGKGLRIDAGKFVTPFGYELIDGYDGYNDQQTRSFLFGYTVPFTHTGLRVGYPFSDRVLGALLVVQGWDNWKDNNSAKSVGAQLALTPSKEWSLFLTAMGGPERTGNNHDDRYDYEITGTYKPLERLSLGFDLVAGRESGLPGPGRSVGWNGAAVYLRCNLNARYALAVRIERFDDGDGARTGIPQTLEEITLTGEQKLGKYFVVRADVRRDASDRAVFEKRADSAKSQTTATAAVLFVH